MPFKLTRRVMSESEDLRREGPGLIRVTAQASSSTVV